MDLLGRKARKELAGLVYENRMKSYEISKLKTELATNATTYAHDRLKLVEALHEKDVEIARLEERLKPFQASASPQRLYMSEDEEEARFAFEQGHITREELERELRKAGFDNASVEFAPEVSDIVY